MEWKKVKWVIIFLLIAVDLFLAANIAFRYTKAYSNEKETLQTAVSLASGHDGFTMDTFSKLPRYMYSYNGQRDTDAEYSLADSVASQKLSVNDSGGGVYVYEGSSRERIIFRRGGSITVIVGKNEDSKSKVKEWAEKNALTTMSEDERISFSFENKPITNAYVEIVTVGEYVAMSGRLPLCSNWQKTEKGRDRGEMVMALLSAVESQNLGALKSVEAVYHLESRGSMGLTLVPAWRAHCENGTVTVSVADKTVIASEQ